MEAADRAEGEATIVDEGLDKNLFCAIGLIKKKNVACHSSKQRMLPAIVVNKILPTIKPLATAVIH